MRIQASLLAIVMAASNSLATVSVSNLTASQCEGSKLVDIYFAADNSDGSEISVSVIISNGTEKVDAFSFQGDVGTSVSEGTDLHVVWDGGADLNGVVVTELSITVQASEPIASGMVHIPAGTNSGSDPDFGSYSLTVADFLMDETEVTRNLWDNHAGGLLGSGKQSDHPVQSVTWFEAVEWCNNRSEDDSLTAAYNPGTWDLVPGANGYRLPTAIEWEYAARGGLEGQRYPWGDEISHDEANYQSTDPDSDYDYHPDFDSGGTPYTSPAGYFDPNGFGLYDMAGNVYEWCDDRNGVLRLRKGGSCESYEVYQRCGSKEYKGNTFESIITGFRTIRDFIPGTVASATIAFDSRDYELTVSSEYGSPVPMVGTSVFAWRSAVTCSVESAVNVGGTNYTCVGWTGSGSVPMVGGGNEVTVVLSNLTSSITWNWAGDDTDFDGMNDDWETFYFGDLAQAYSNDFDSDGQFNGDEYIAGTNPTNSASLFQLTERLEPGRIIIEWPAASNRFL
ncbi:SUMF1/EgtB/PvdO family nonheme iron enzyme [Pontiellaceae bacterium B12227]|nr:SUMF1/EgtB/PvdO family nonheme iron enzyme [Pontiellaceae bacterium B12227]